jgi:RNA polymerase sigma factor (sigma-70 family)
LVGIANHSRWNFGSAHRAIRYDRRRRGNLYLSNSPEQADAAGGLPANPGLACAARRRTATFVSGRRRSFSEVGVDLHQRKAQLALHQKTLHRFAQEMTNNSEAAGDLLQDAAVAVLEHPLGPPDHEQFARWCRTVVWHLDQHRRRGFGRRAAHEEPGGLLENGADSPSTDPTHDPERILSAKEILARLIAGLDEESLRFLDDRYVLEKTPHEIALSLGVTSSSVRMRMARLLGRLRG